MTTLSTPLPVAVQSTVDGKVFQFPNAEHAEHFEALIAGDGGQTQRLVPAPPPLSRPLYDLESHLAALLDTEDVVPEELEQEYALELHATLVATTEKRDRVGQFREHLKAQIAFSHAEASRLRDRETYYQHALDKLDSYITRVIEMLGLDAKDKRKKLEGHTCTIGLHGCDKRAEVIAGQEEAVPSKYKRVTVTLPADTWELLCDSLDLDLRDQVLAEVTSPKVEVSLSKVKGDLKAGVSVDGCQLVGGTYVEIK